MTALSLLSQLTSHPRQWLRAAVLGPLPFSTQGKCQTCTYLIDKPNGADEGLPYGSDSQPLVV